MTKPPLDGITVIEMEGIGPCPMAGMMLADMGARVILVGRKQSNSKAAAIHPEDRQQAFYHRGKESINVDLKQPQAVELVQKLISQADVLIEGFRPQVMERLGLGPEILLQANPKLVFGRLTGWGQDGPLAAAAGHDTNYQALSGAMYYGGAKDRVPNAPLTLVGDVGGGTMMLLWGVMCALWQAQATGQGQVVDAAMCNGTAYLSGMLWMMRNTGQISEPAGQGWADGAAPWNQTYTCADGLHINICSLEPPFYQLLLDKLGLSDDALFAQQWDKPNWPQAKAKLTALFVSQSRKHWCQILEGSDVCFAPVLSMTEALQHPHNQARKMFWQQQGVDQPAPGVQLYGMADKAPAVANQGAQSQALVKQANMDWQALLDAGAV
ncbi:MAG: CoA transferase [Gammaproteobacteria bacterium]|nr:CoA transferase [Gammaproteobacteria bacterium]MCP4879139.1 CoA transferase [Gammaproteobacteria bacterium]